jgi:AraC-like DNA-binding protein
MSWESKKYKYRLLTLATGEQVPLCELERRSGRSASNISARIKKGMSPDEAAFAPRHRKLPMNFDGLTLDGQSVTVDEVARIASVAPGTVRARLRRGLSVDDVVATERVSRAKRVKTASGEFLTAKQIAARTGLSIAGVHRRLGAGESVEALMARPHLRREEDISGEVFGQLTVVGREKKQPGRTARRWLCRCTCGNERKVLGSDLRSGNQKSCGCQRAPRGRATLGRGVDLFGKTFGRLTIIEAATRTRKNGRHHARVWSARCDCGTIVSDLPTGSLTSGGVRSCGCLARDMRARKVTLFGQVLSREELMELTGLSSNTLHRRLNVLKMTPEECVRVGRMRTGPPKGASLKRRTLHGHRVTLAQLSKLSGFCVATVIKKLRKMTPEQLVAGAA